MAKQDSDKVLQELTSLIRTDGRGKKHLSVMGVSGANRKPWFEVFSAEEISAQFAENHRRIKEAEAYAKRPGRPLNALLLATSGRNNKLSCAHENSRSTEVLNVAKKRLKELGVKEQPAQKQRGEDTDTSLRSETQWATRCRQGSRNDRFALPWSSTSRTPRSPHQLASEGEPVSS